MSEHNSFRPSDFSLRDLPGFFAGYLVISVVAVGIGLLLERVPEFWRGVLLGVGLGMMLSSFLFGRPQRTVGDK